MKKFGLILSLFIFFTSTHFAQIISQYVETNSGTTPKGIEVWNNTTSELDFATNNLEVQQGTNGGALSTTYTISTGTLAAGAVLVIGTSDMEATANGNGAAFYLKAFTFNGDDALALVYGGSTTDVLGTPGVDPGSAWSGSGVATANQNIQLISGITTGDLDGWEDPSLRFEVVSTDPVNDLTGFGLAPGLTSPSLITAPASLSDFTYVFGSGPSTSQSYDISGSNLDGSDVTITAPSDYEISLDDANWSSSRTLTAFDGTGTTIYVRLKAGLSAGTYNSEIISNAGGGATTQNVNCNGNVTAPIPALPLVEDFDYATGDLTSVSSANWVNFSGTGNFIQTTSGSLSYSGYPSSGIGNKIEIISTSSSAEDAYYQFATQSEGTKVYASFLLNIPSTSGLSDNSSATGDYFVAFLPSTSTTAYDSRVSIRLGTAVDTYQIGLRASNNNTEAVWSTTDLDINTTYLIVFSYEIISGEGNDIASLWINPSLTGSEPSADLTQTVATDINEVSRIAIRQGGSTPNASIDGIRVAADWNLAPLPVELTSFTASIVTNSVNLKWNTATEVNNYGFEIQRSAVSDKQSAESWNKIGFVKGNGNSNSPKNYYFVDENVNSGKYYYRLKQTDFDGKYTFSKVVEADISSPDVYSLDQNYPNPFNPVTTIKYEIPKAGKVKIVIFDMLGRVVQTLVNEFKEAGRYNVQFDAGKLASGTYLYQIQAGNFTEVKKMILIK